MALIVLVGGARSGKSGVAKELALAHNGEVTVLVGPLPEDGEMTRRVERHVADRPAAWTVLTLDDDPVAAVAGVGEEDLLVVDCLGVQVSSIVAGVMDTVSEEATGEQEQEVTRRVDDVVTALISRNGDTLVVTNEVGMGVVPGHPMGRVFRDEMGRSNRRLIDKADSAWFVVGGRCVDLSDQPGSLVWPS